ncbi:hypothetical protein ORV05_25080 [Amycolatopsis cynarae]|uniref:PE domain-containing protein n=1 Tax=Amycolatopsis cynarae TaxID=2995223 RepID=A0ABY7AZY6_9PSEU|nr:hypothetical protein [Amycolatopsis sp. HUAS 11-8]WAL64231.1 hypothetical protein ORV05_25080 [Amycolatopsis sp. HUAS 11-8]
MSWWDDVKFVVTGEQSTAVKANWGQAFAGGAPGGTAGGSGSAGVISMNREEMEDTLKRAQNLLNEITKAQESAPRLANVRPPAFDPASVAATASVNKGGQYYVGHLRRQIAYLNTITDKMQKALGDTVEADEEAAGTVQRTGEGAYG